MADQKVAIVTGASSGIGFAIAKKLIDHDYKVFGLSRTMPNLKGLQFLQTDVTKDEAIKGSVKGVLSESGRIDLLINNAGLVLTGGVEESSISQIKSLFDTNFFGAVALTQAVLPTMRSQKQGRILHVSSVVGFVPAPYMAYYCASKHALEGFSESLDHEVRSFGIRSILIEPGFTKTSINSNALKADQTLQAYEKSRGTMMKVAEEGVNRASSPDQVANLILKVVDTTQPELRYAAGPDAKLLKIMRGLLPSSLFEKGVRKQFHLDKICATVGSYLNQTVTHNKQRELYAIRNYVL